MIEPQLNIPQWLELPLDTRRTLSEIFSIPRSSSTEIMDNQVISDGHTHDDLSRINVPSLQAYLGSTGEDFFMLFSMLLMRLDEDRAKAQAALAEQAQVAADAELEAEQQKIVNSINLLTEAAPKKKSTKQKT